MMKKEYTPERRPLGARKWNASHAAAAWLAARGVSPNSISVAGFVASLGACAAFVATRGSDQPALLLAAACAFILIRGMCNMLDGMVAVSTGKASPGGELFNEVPDRLSDSGTLVGAGYAVGGIPELGYAAASHLEGCFRALPPGSRFPKPLSLAVTVGKPIRFDDCPDNRTGWDAIAARLQVAVEGFADHP